MIISALWIEPRIENERMKNIIQESDIHVTSAFYTWNEYMNAAALAVET